MLFDMIKALYISKLEIMLQLRRKHSFLEDCRAFLGSLETLDFKDILFSQIKSCSGSFQISLNVGCFL